VTLELAILDCKAADAAKYRSGRDHKLCRCCGDVHGAELHLAMQSMPQVSLVQTFGNLERDTG